MLKISIPILKYAGWMTDPDNQYETELLLLKIEYTWKPEDFTGCLLVLPCSGVSSCKMTKTSLRAENALL